MSLENCSKCDGEFLTEADDYMVIPSENYALVCYKCIKQKDEEMGLFAKSFENFFDYMQENSDDVEYIGNTHQDNAIKVIEKYKERIKQKDEVIDKLVECVDESLAIAENANPDTYNNSEALRLCVKLQLETLKEIEEMKQRDR